MTDPATRFEEICADVVRESLLSGKPHHIEMEWLWQEIEEMLEGERTVEKRDAIEDMTLADIIAKVAAKAAARSCR